MNKGILILLTLIIALLVAMGYMIFEILTPYQPTKPVIVEAPYEPIQYEHLKEK